MNNAKEITLKARITRDKKVITVWTRQNDKVTEMLKEAKAELKHGEWTPYLEAIGIPRNTAHRLLNPKQAEETAAKNESEGNEGNENEEKAAILSGPTQKELIGVLSQIVIDIKKSDASLLDLPSLMEAMDIVTAANKK